MYRMFPSNTIVALLLILEGILLYLTTVYQKGKILKFTIFVFFILLSGNLLINQFDKGIFTISNLESERIRARQEYYAPELGKIYRNKVGLFYFNNLRLYFSKISYNLFSHIDIQQLFSLNKIFEYNKMPLFFAPVFIIGFLYFLINLPKTVVTYLFLAMIVSSLTSFNSRIGTPLLMPFINLCIAFGLMKLIQLGKIKNFKSK